MYKLTFIDFILPFFSWFNSYEVLIKFVLFIMSWPFILTLSVSENWHPHNLVTTQDVFIVPP